jgi:hypothetical protein
MPDPNDEPRLWTRAEITSLIEERARVIAVEMTSRASFYDRVQRAGYKAQRLRS